MYTEAVDVPEGIFTLEGAMVGLDVGAAFESRFAGVDGYVLKAQVARAEEGTLPSEFFIADCFHGKLT